MHVSALLRMLTPISSSPASSFLANACTRRNCGKLYVKAYAAEAARIPVWRMPPPNIFRNQRAFAMNSFVPTKQEPTGAPRVKVSLKAQISSMIPPKPLLKQRLIESKGSHSSLMVLPVSAATCQILAPSRCVLRPRECA